MIWTNISNYRQRALNSARAYCFLGLVVGIISSQEAEATPQKRGSKTGLVTHPAIQHLTISKQFTTNKIKALEKEKALLNERLEARSTTIKNKLDLIEKVKNLNDSLQKLKIKNQIITKKYEEQLAIIREKELQSENTIQNLLQQNDKQNQELLALNSKLVKSEFAIESQNKRIQELEGELIQMIKSDETKLTNLQIAKSRNLNQNDKAWLSKFLAKQKLRFDEWQNTKKKILGQVVKQGLLHDLRDPLEELLIEEDFLTQQEQLQLATWGVEMSNSTVEGNPTQAEKVVNNEIQGSFVFNVKDAERESKLMQSLKEKEAFLEYYKQGLTQQAIEQGEAILEVTPNNSKMIYNMSLLHIKRKEFNQAKSYAQQLLDLSADNYQGHYLQGLIAYYQQDIKQAKIALEQTLNLNPEFASAWLYFGHLLNYSEEYTEAKKAFEKVIDLQGESASIYYNLAVLSQKINNPKEGVYYYQKSLDLGGEIDVDLANKLLTAAQ